MEIFFLPLALRLAKTFRPLAVAILSRNPCLFLLFLLEGWKVLFIVLMHYLKAGQIYNIFFLIQMVFALFLLTCKTKQTICSLK